MNRMHWVRLMAVIGMVGPSHAQLPSGDYFVGDPISAYSQSQTQDTFVCGGVTWNWETLTSSSTLDVDLLGQATSTAVTAGTGDGVSWPLIAAGTSAGCSLEKVAEQADVGMGWNASDTAEHVVRFTAGGQVIRDYNQPDVGHSSFNVVDPFGGEGGFFGLQVLEPSEQS